jgi:hypothetical protein
VDCRGCRSTKLNEEVYLFSKKSEAQKKNTHTHAGNSVQTFWTILTRKSNWDRPTILSRAALIPALWEDLSFIYNLVTAADNLGWLREEVKRRMAASLRFAWIAAVVGRRQI